MYNTCFVCFYKFHFPHRLWPLLSFVRTRSVRFLQRLESWLSSLPLTSHTTTYRTSQKVRMLHAKIAMGRCVPVCVCVAWGRERRTIKVWRERESAREREYGVGGEGGVLFACADILAGPHTEATVCFWNRHFHAFHDNTYPNIHPPPWLFASFSTTSITSLFTTWPHSITLCPHISHDVITMASK